MEQIYVPRYKNTIHIESHFNSFKANLGCALNIPSTTAHIKQLMNFEGTDDDFASLEDSVSLHQLAHIDDLKPMPFDPSESSTRRHSVTRVPKNALHLKTVSALIDVQGKYNESHRNRYIVYNKYKHINTSHENDEDQRDLNVNDEVVLSLRFYEPFTYRPNANCDLKPKLSQAFLVLGSQTLAEFRDRLHCDSKFAPLYDISENPDKPDESDTSTFDHGFFFIGDTFYNDTRHPTIDYSDVIRNWAKNHDNIAELKTESMEETKFEDLTVRLGYPYLYQHYGNCEHLFTISDIRLISATDSLVRDRYPMLKIVSSTKSIICMICGVNEANIVVKDSSAHINDPSHLCTNCFKSYHYIDGKKVGSFKAYRYYGNTMTE